MPHPPDVYPDSGFRLPLPKREELDEAGQKAMDRLLDPKNGSIVGLRGPGGIRLYNAELAAIAEPLNRYLRYRAGLSGHVREVAILATARQFDSQFEWAAHEGVARKEGVPEAVIDAIRHRKPTAGLPEADAVIIELGREAFGDKRVKPETFARALKQFGPKDLVTLTTLMGEYSATAMFLATFDMQLPPGVEPGLPVP